MNFDTTENLYIEFDNQKVLKLARTLLSDGVIFISIGDNEVHNLRNVCDKVFGGGNFG